MAKRERMSSVDTAWLRMDRPTNLMMIVGVMIFDGPMAYERLKELIATRFCSYRRFRQRVCIETAGAYWEDAEDFDVADHVKRTALPGKGGKEELEQLVADLATTPLDANRPPWQFLLVENYQGGAALVARIHHCIADGIALMGVLLAMTDEDPIGSAPAREAKPAETRKEATEADFWDKVFEPMTAAATTAIKFSGALWGRYVAMLANPQQAFDYARVAAAIGNELAQLATMPDDSPTRLKGKPGLVKRVAWSEPMPLEEIKAVGKALGCSVNDILLSCVAGALRQYLAEHGDTVDGVELRALVPVNLRGAGQEDTLGNQFGLVALVLPVGIGHPMARLYEVRRRMNELKGSYQAPVTLGLLGFVGLCPKAVQERILDLLAAKATAVMTNVPGPQKPLYLAGARLVQQMVWVPQSGDIGIGVSILSYNGAVQFGLITDRRLLPDPESVVSQFRPEFEKILYTILMEPWGEQAATEEAPAVAEPAPTKAPRRPRAKATTATPEVAARRIPKRFR